MTHRAAGRAALGHGRAGAAVMAAQGHGGGMEDERALALRADLHVAAIAAQDDAGGATPVDEQDGPVTGRGVERLERSGQGRREQAPVAFRQLSPHIDELHGHGRTGATPPQSQVLRLPCSCPPDGDDVGRGRTEDRPAPRRWPPGPRPGRAPGSVVCDRPCRPRRAPRRPPRGPAAPAARGPPCACPRPPAPRRRADATPLIGTLTLAEGTVDHDHVLAQVVPQTVDERRGQGDLGHQHERATPGREGCRDAIRVHGGLAAGGVAVEQHRLLPALHRWPNGRPRRPQPAPHRARSRADGCRAPVRLARRGGAGPPCVPLAPAGHAWPAH